MPSQTRFPSVKCPKIKLAHYKASRETFHGNRAPLVVCWGLERECGPEAGGEQLRHLVHDPVQPLLPVLVCESVHVENVARGERELYLLVVSLMCTMLGESTQL